MRGRTVAELRDDAKVLIPHLDLEQIYAVNTSLRVHDRTQSRPFVCDTDLRVKGERVDGRIETWARYVTTACTDNNTGDIDDIEVPEPTTVWTALVEGVAVFALDDPDMETSEDQIEAFTFLVGMPALHPYAREWTQTLTGQSQYPAFTLGMLESLAGLDLAHVIEFPDREESTTT